MKKEFRYGKKIKEVREARAWSQEQLAMAAGIDVRTVQRVERDLGKSPSPETLHAIAGAFDADLATLRTSWLVPETRLEKTWLITSHRQFVNVEESHVSHVCNPMILAPLTDDAVKQTEDLLDQIFADRDCIGPRDTDLWKPYVDQIEEPLTTLFGLKLAIFLLHERRDLILPMDGPIKPIEQYSEDWRVQHFLVVPRHGCFRANPEAPLHRFNPDCPAAGDALFTAIKDKQPGLHVLRDALVAIADEKHPSVTWCDRCFPVSGDGSRLNFDYLEKVTGLRRDQLYEMYEAYSGSDLQGLS